MVNINGETKDGNKETVFSLQSKIGELPNWRGATWNLELAFGQKDVSAFHVRSLRFFKTLLQVFMFH